MQSWVRAVVAMVGWMLAARVGLAQAFSTHFPDGQVGRVASLSDGTVAGIVHVQAAGFSNVRSHVVRLDDAGDVTWARTFGDSVALGALLVMSDRIVVGGSCSSCSLPGGGASNGAFVAALGLDGRLIWQVFLPGTYTLVTRLVASSDGDIGFAGWGTGLGSTRSETGPIIGKLGMDGSLRWARGILAGPDAWVSDFGLVPMASGGLMFGASCRVTAQRAWLAAFTDAGVRSWEFELASPSDKDGVADMAPDGAGGALVLGRSLVDESPSLVHSDNWVLRVDDRGRPQWSTSLWGSCQSDAWAIAPDPAGGYRVASTTREAGIERPHVIRLDASGSVVEETYLDAAGGLFWLAPRTGGGWFLGEYGSAGILRLDASLAGSLPCVTPTAATCGSNAVTLVRSAVSLPSVSLSAVAASAVLSTSSLATNACDASACPVLRPGRIVASPAAPCTGVPVTLTAVFEGGEPPITVGWDLDGDLSPDVFGNPVVVSAPAGPTWSVRAIVSDACSYARQDALLSLQVGLGPPLDEVTGLRLSRTRPGTRVTAVPAATAYDVLVAPLGDWYGARGSGLSSCAESTWQDPGDGTIILPTEPAAGSWVLVTVSSACGSGPAGADSLGRERSGRPGWQGCP